ncbi:hypothetical protein ASPCAL13699 [Aspergillus calidoustus]|uniref:N-acetyltransferase domain-containing protein n=1 Tax=Aspergillus calidoustus TaxID=454130 RepID=A0A0U5GFC7_ASPCI|nr:hypothetical protein ASPCAL13699 [Aspergillus calidoustus]
MSTASPSSSYTLVPFSPSRIPQTAELLFTSKLGLTINRLLFKNWPNEEIQRRNYTAVLEGQPRSGSEALSVLDEVSGEVLGHLSITRKRPLQEKKDNIEEEKAGEGKQEVPDFFNPEVLAAVQSAVGELSSWLDGVDHLEITYIIVAPAHRNHGIGRMLMEYVLDKAKSLNIPVSLSSEPQVYAFFKKWGFQDTKHVDFDLAEWAPPHSGFGIFRLAGLIWYP